MCVAGDGTTATVLTRSIFREGCKAVAADMNPTDVRRGIVFFGLWSVYVPPSPLGPVGQSIVPGTISRGSLGCRDRLPAERGPGTG